MRSQSTYTEADIVGYFWKMYCSYLTGKRNICCALTLDSYQLFAENIPLLRSRFTSTLRIGCCRPSSGSQQASARQRGGTRGKMCSASSSLLDSLHLSNWFSAPSSLLLCLARACCVPELGRHELILTLDVNLD